MSEATPESFGRLMRELEQASAEVRTQRGEMRESLAQARAELDAARSEPLLEPGERDDLQQAAREGRLGEDMAEFADDVERGEADWETFLRGESRPQLLHAFVERTVEEHGDELVSAAAEMGPPEEGEQGEEPGRR